MAMQPNALGFVRKSRVEGLAALKPSDGRFLAVKLSEDSVFPPADEAVEEIAELRREAFKCYNEADNQHGFAAAQLLSEIVSAKKQETDSLQTSFDEVVYCYSAAESAEQMELSARNPQMVVAGQWKLIRLHTQKRLAEYNEQKATAAAAAAALTAESRKRKRSSVISATTTLVSPTTPNENMYTLKLKIKINGAAQH
jgi:hypothetical protein